VTKNKGNKMDDVNKQERDEGCSKTSLPELSLSRRRLVRSVTAVAPVILTLRSGAVVAAVSCVGAKAIGAQTNGSGQITSLNGGNAAAGDSCVTGFQVCTNPNQSTKILPTGTVAGSVTANGGGVLSCGNVSNQPVAILSATSVTSLIATRQQT
jgi:hypothetical protein